MKYLGSRGDTIVEVLLAIAVASAVLGGAYVSANRSLNGTRQAQERAEAVKFVEGQLERLKEVAKTDTTVFNTPPNPFCITETSTPSGVQLNRVVSGDPGCRQGTDGRYALQIQRDTSGGTTTFTASARWDRVGGGGQDQVILVYRMYR